MEGRFVSVDGGLGENNDPEKRPWSISDLWQIWKVDKSELEPFEIVGVAAAELHLKLEESEVVNKLVLVNEYGTFDVSASVNIDAEYVVIDERIVPINQRDLHEIKNCLEVSGLSLGTKVSKSEFVKLITASRVHDIEIKLEPDFEFAVENDPITPNLRLILGEPYGYQKIGIEWLSSNYSNSIGSLLCDEMGLGKTYQALGLIAHAIETGEGPVLVCCPASLIRNWMNEVETFTPSVTTLVYTGQARHSLFNQIENHQIVLSTYDILVRDLALLEKVAWNVIIADEAQALKNPSSQRHLAIKSLQARAKVLVTGTPFENHLTDLWALSEIVQPGLLGEFSALELAKEQSTDAADEIGQLVGPIMLRREVSEVATDLPPLVVIDEEIEPSNDFSEMYEKIRSSLIEGSQSNFLATITKLQQLCCHPSLIDTGFVDESDAKFTRLSEILDELFLLGRDKVLIFTTFTQSIMLVKNFIARRYGPEMVSIINGSIPPDERQSVVETFNSAHGFKVLVINPKAGGAGLNITGANHVIHFNRQWNPAVELQATARAFRRKQQKTVFLHNFYYSQTIEEVIHDRLLGKLRLSEVALENSLSQDDDIYRSMALYVSPNKINKQPRGK
jgi:SNF2 family DNA or RNA helicase